VREGSLTTLTPIDPTSIKGPTIAATRLNLKFYQLPLAALLIYLRFNVYGFPVLDNFHISGAKRRQSIASTVRSGVSHAQNQ
jgi:hypothetical protein